MAGLAMFCSLITGHGFPRILQIPVAVYVTQLSRSLERQ
jgi:hypothetical protein